MIFINPWVEFHASLAVFAYAVFALLALVSLMYILQDFALSRKRIGGLFERLPALSQLDSASERLLLVGVVVMTIATLLGTLTWLGSANLVGLSSLLPAWAIWLGYLVLFIGRIRTWVTHVQMAWAGLILFVVAVLALWPVLGGMLHG
jgi:ABC-type uncharacterized transport system permease subunit